jgi:hypothetical protein
MPELGAFQRAFGRALLRNSSPNDEERLRPLGVALVVHRNTAMKGLVDALTANYPTVRQLVGDECFKACAIEYVRMHPAGSPVLAIYGGAFPDFLAAFAPAADLPYLTEVARIDRMWIEALMAPDATSLASSSLASLGSRALGELRLAMHPATRFAWARHSAATIWVHHRTTPSDALTIADSEEGVLLTRQGGAIEYQLLDYAAFKFLESLQDGAPLGTAAEAALQIDANADVSRVLAQSIAAGAFADLPEIHS